MRNSQADDDLVLRQAMFDHLERCLAGAQAEFLSSHVINTFEFQGQPIRLIVQTGIRKLRDHPGALTIRTTYTPPSVVPPYVDDVGADGLVRYKYRGEEGGTRTTGRYAMPWRPNYP
ncbi:hypothetical protein [Ferrimicrobium sp.]|uniref:hypothetical protein n=1 Tax=Ferrimicrobium sp. TaxID=2926050 RepID=UPI00263532BC|nr:hypothetical protein [Ferrimicrobium sp.]